MELLHVDAMDASLLTDGRLDIAFVSGPVATQPRMTHVRVGIGRYG